jgi:putative endonuclease
MMSVNDKGSQKADFWRKETGSLGEFICSTFLERKGYRIIDRNYRRPWGEIDVVAEKSGIVHFVEVKSVSVSDFSREMTHNPEDLVDARKLRKLSRTASLYMESVKDTREFQIDVVGVLLNKGKRAARCRHFEQVLG